MRMPLRMHTLRRSLWGFDNISAATTSKFKQIETHTNFRYQMFEFILSFDLWQFWVSLTSRRHNRCSCQCMLSAYLEILVRIQHAHLPQWHWLLLGHPRPPCELREHLRQHHCRENIQFVSTMAQQYSGTHSGIPQEPLIVQWFSYGHQPVHTQKKMEFCYRLLNQKKLWEIFSLSIWIDSFRKIREA